MTKSFGKQVFGKFQRVASEETMTIYSAVGATSFGNGSFGPVRGLDDAWLNAGRSQMDMSGLAASGSTAEPEYIAAQQATPPAATSASAPSANEGAPRAAGSGEQPLNAANDYFSLAAGNFSQNWSNTGLITANDDWSNVPNISGFLGEYTTSTATGVDPQTVTTQVASSTVDVIANQTNPNTLSNGGVAEFELTNPTIALNGSGGADAPNIVIYLNATGRENIVVSYNLRDLDGSADNANQQVALQYRTSPTADWINVPAGYVADATTGPNLATLVTPVSVTLPAGANNAATLQVRIITTNAPSNDEWVGIDDIVVASSPAPGGSGPGAFSISDATVTEGNSGTTPITFTVTRPAGSTGAVTVDYALAFGTGSTFADAADFSGATSGTLTFAAGDFSETITLNVVGDTLGEQTETFTVTLSSPTGGATIATGSGGAPDAGIGTITNDDVTLTRIFTIQGAQHTSPLNGSTVTTTGIVTAVDTNGFYLQDATGDGNIATSDAIFVFTSTAPTVSVGQDITLTGTVSEFFPGGAGTGNLSTTQLSSVTGIIVNSSGNTLPAAVILGPGGRVLPTEIIEDDNFASFDPTTDGIDFYESLEAMLVHVPGGARVVAPTTDNGEIYLVTDGATNLSSRGTINIDGATGGAVGTTNQGQGSDFNPERIQLDNDSFTPGTTPQVDVGAILEGVTGVVTYNFGEYEIAPTSAIVVRTASTLTPEVTGIVGTADRMSVASYNVENLDPSDGPRFTLLAQQIRNALGSPDVIGLQEIQDNNGPTNDSVTSASVTLEKLVNALNATGPGTYAFIDNPFIADDQNGGQGGANIRNAFLYRTDRVTLVEGSLTTTLTPEQLAAQRAGDANSPFAGTRLPLVATFTFAGEDVTVIDNHFSSKIPSTPLFGSVQPSVNSDEAQRLAQAQNVADYVASLGNTRSIVVLGDLNEFETEEALVPLSTTGGLTDLVVSGIVEEERYSFIFDGNSQQLDHLYVTSNLLGGALIDIVHVNTEFVNAPTDHDPSVATLALPTGSGGFNSNDSFSGTAGNNLFNGDGGEDFFLLQAGGNDTAFGGAGDDAFLLGASFTADDRINGGAGLRDQLGLQGDYSAGVTLGAATITGIEGIVFLSSPGDTFDYRIVTNDANLAAGAVVTVTAAQLLASQDVFFDGRAETDGSFRFVGGFGTDTLFGGSQSDGFFFGDGRYNPLVDAVDGGAGVDDQFGLDGNYSGANAVTFAAGSLTGIETIAVFADFDYDLTVVDANLQGTGQMTVNGGQLGVGDTLAFNGAAETSGSFRFIGGRADDSFIGSANADLIIGQGGGDRLDGRGGADVFMLQEASESTSTGFDTLVRLDFVGGDKIDLPTTITAIDSAASGSLSIGTFDNDLAAAMAGLDAGSAALFTANAGDQAGKTFLVADGNGIAGYQAGEDYVFLLETPPPPGDLNVGVFV